MAEEEAPREKRERKATVEVYSVASPTKKEFVIPLGAGTKVGDIPNGAATRVPPLPFVDPDCSPGGRKRSDLDRVY